MIHLSLLEFAETVGGKLRLGHPPPLGGPHEPLMGRFQIDPTALRPSDVWWNLGDCKAGFVSPAAGVVTKSAHHVPLAGGFSVQVDDPRWALWQLAREARQRFAGQVIGVADDDGLLVTALLRSVLGDASQGPAECETSSLAAQLALVNADEQARALVFPIGRADDPDNESLLTLVQPSIVIALDPSPEARFNLLRWLPDDGALVVAYDTPRRDATRLPFGCRQIEVGRGARSEIVAARICHDGNALQLQAAGIHLRLTGLQRHDVPRILSVWVVARLCGLDDAAIASRLNNAETTAIVAAGLPQRTDVDGVTLIHDMSPSFSQSWLNTLRCVGERGRSARPRLGVFRPDSQQTTYPSPPHSSFHRRHLLVDLTNETASEELFELAKTITHHCGADEVHLFGPQANLLIQQLVELGTSERRCYKHLTQNTATEKLAAATPGDIVIALGRMPELVSRLRQARSTRPKQFHKAA